MDALKKEMTNISFAFHIPEHGESPPQGTGKHLDTWFEM